MNRILIPNWGKYTSIFITNEYPTIEGLDNTFRVLEVESFQTNLIQYPLIYHSFSITISEESSLSMFIRIMLNE